MMTTNSRKTLTKKELKKGFFRTFTTSHAWHYERQQHMAFEYAMIPVINKLYDKEEDSAILSGKSACCSYHQR